MAHLTEPQRWIAAVVLVDTDECVEWPFAQSTGGYGCYRRHGQPIAAHRTALALVTVLAGDEIPEGLNALHRCDNPPCCNPAHLRWGTQGDNVSDAWNRERRTASPLRGEASPRTALLEDDVRSIRAAVEHGETYATVAGRFGVSKSTVGNVVNRVTWAHVD